jgi:hypothetical protein
MKLSFKLLVVFPFMLFFLGTQDYARLSAQRPKGKSDNVTTHENAPRYKVTHYDITSVVAPAERSLAATAVLTVSTLEDNVASIRVFLHNEFTVESVSSESRSLKFILFDQSKDLLFFSRTGVPIDIDLPRSLKKGETAKIEIAYAGKITSVINDVNLVSEHLTELALYSSWFPLIHEGTDFTYSLRITLPANYLCITDGELEQKTAGGEKTTYCFRRERLGMDIPVLASDNLKVKRLEVPGFQAELYYRNLDDAKAGEFIQDAVDGYHLLEQKVGEAMTRGRMVLVVSPRNGWGYSRVPLFVVSEVYMLDLLKQPNGKMESIHGNLHEMGHFWWQLASPSTSDDWINESLAEFFSLYACESLFGKESVNSILKAYTERVRGLKDPKPIVETMRGDRDGYVLYYEKGALIWEMLREKLGEEKLFAILRKYYAAHKNGPPATTQNLIDAFATATNGETNDFFAEFLKTASLSNLRVNVGKWY